MFISDLIFLKSSLKDPALAKVEIRTKNIRLTLDYREDYIIIKKIFDNLYKKNKYFTLEQILKFLKKNKKITNINKKYINLQWKKFHSKRTVKS